MSFVAPKEGVDFGSCFEYAICLNIFELFDKHFGFFLVGFGFSLGGARLWRSQLTFRCSTSSSARKFCSKFSFAFHIFFEHFHGVLRRYFWVLVTFSFIVFVSSAECAKCFQGIWRSSASPKKELLPTMGFSVCRSCYMLENSIVTCFNVPVKTIEAVGLEWHVWDVGSLFFCCSSYISCSWLAEAFGFFPWLIRSVLGGGLMTCSSRRFV